MFSQIGLFRLNSCHFPTFQAPRRRSIFGAPDAIKYRGLTADRRRELEIDFVGIDDINSEGLLYDENDRYCREHMDINVTDEQLTNVAGLAVAMERLIKKYHCNAGAIQCWNALQDELGIMPCAANALLNDKGIPVVCETDIHGAVTALMVEAAALNGTRSFFAGWTIRHPDIENGEFLQHCGPWSLSVAGCRPCITYPLAFDYPGAITAEAKHGQLTLARFDGDNGEYSLLLGNAKGVDGPKGMGTYLWVEVDNIKRLEAKVVEGPYIHHCVGIHKDVVPVLYEACKYIGVKPDLYVGWNVIDVAGGNDLDELHAAFEAAKLASSRPTAIIAHTVKGKGSSLTENKAAWHHKVPDEVGCAQIMDDLDAAIAALSC